MNDCIFCKIIKGEIPSFKIYEDEQTYAFLDISKDCYGHTLVIPKQHYSDIFEIPEKALSSTIKTTKLICNHYKELGFEGANIINNNSECAEQTIKHLHFHIIPRKVNDGLKIFPLFTTKEINLEDAQKFLYKKSWH